MKDITSKFILVIYEYYSFCFCKTLCRLITHVFCCLSVFIFAQKNTFMVLIFYFSFFDTEITKSDTHSQCSSTLPQCCWYALCSAQRPLHNQVHFLILKNLLKMISKCELNDMYVCTRWSYFFCTWCFISFVHDVFACIHLMWNKKSKNHKRDISYSLALYFFFIFKRLFNIFNLFSICL